MGQSHPRFVSWAAQDGRVDDLVYHLRLAGKNSLQPSARSPKKRAPVHLAAIRGHSQCVKVLFDAGEGALEECNHDGGRVSLRFLAGGERWRGSYGAPLGRLQPALRHGAAAAVSRSQAQLHDQVCVGPQVSGATGSRSVHQVQCDSTAPGDVSG